MNIFKQRWVESISFTATFRGKSLRWRHNGRDGVSNHQPHDCLLNRLFRRRSKKMSKLRVTGLCVGKSPGPVISPHKWPVTRKMFPFDDVIIYYLMTPWHGHTFHITDPLCMETAGEDKGRQYWALMGSLLQVWISFRTNSRVLGEMEGLIPG